MTESKQELRKIAPELTARLNSRTGEFVEHKVERTIRRLLEKTDELYGSLLALAHSAKAKRVVHGFTSRSTGTIFTSTEKRRKLE